MSRHVSIVMIAATTCALVGTQARADEELRRALTGSWAPVASVEDAAARSVLVFAPDGRFAAIATAKDGTTGEVEQLVDVVNGHWFVGEDGGAVALRVDDAGGESRGDWVQFVLVEDRLRPYPVAGEHPFIAGFTWRLVAPDGVADARARSAGRGR